MAILGEFEAEGVCCCDCEAECRLFFQLGRCWVCSRGPWCARQGSGAGNGELGKGVVSGWMVRVGLKCTMDLLLCHCEVLSFSRMLFGALEVRN